MEHSEILSLLETINLQVSSAILGGMDEQYRELEDLGLIKYDTDSAQWSASLTQKGHDYLKNNIGDKNF